MQILDILILAVVVLWLGLIVWFGIRKRKRRRAGGSVTGCSGCCAGCSSCYAAAQTQVRTSKLDAWDGASATEAAESEMGVAAETDH